MKLSKIHRVLKLKQFDWMKKYVDFNSTEKKQKLLMNLKKNIQIDDQFCLWQNNGKLKRKS